MERTWERVLSRLVLFWGLLEIVLDLIGRVPSMIPSYLQIPFVLLVLAYITWLDKDRVRDALGGKGYKLYKLLSKINRCIDASKKSLEYGNMLSALETDLYEACSDLSGSLETIGVKHPDLGLDLGSDAIVTFWLDYLIGIRKYAQDKDIEQAKKFGDEMSKKIVPK